MTFYYSNDVVLIEGSFTDSAGTATDPTALTLVVQPYKGTAVTYEYPADITKDATGEYSMEWTAPTVTHLTVYGVQWLPTGAVQRASDPVWISVDPVLG